MTSRLVVDSYAWVEYLEGTDGGRKVKEALENKANEVYTCAVTIAEVVSKAVRTARDPEAAYTAIVSNSHVIDVDDQISRSAGYEHAAQRRRLNDFGLADTYVLVSARRISGKILTGDPHFANVPEAIMI